MEIQKLYTFFCSETDDKFMHKEVIAHLPGCVMWTVTSKYDEYVRLAKQTGGVDPTRQSGDERRLDQLYQEIVSSPVTDLGAALEKLWFAHHCLLSEDDAKEAANLIHQVCHAFERLMAASQDPDTPVA